MSILTHKVASLAWAVALVFAGCSCEGGNTASKAKSPVSPESAAADKAAETAPAANNAPVPLPEGEVVAEGGDKSYTFKVVASPQSATGKPAAVAVEVVPKSGWKMNMDFPTKLLLKAPDTATIEGGEQTKDDAAEFGDHRALWISKVTPAAAGAKELSVELRFAVCTATTCVPKREQATWAMTVQ